MSTQKSNHSRILRKISIIIGVIVLFCLAIVQFPEECMAAEIKIIYKGGNGNGTYEINGRKGNQKAGEPYGITVSNNIMTIEKNDTNVHLTVEGSLSNIILNGRSGDNINISLEKEVPIQVNGENSIGSITANNIKLTLNGGGNCSTTGISAGSGDITFDNTGQITVTSTGITTAGNITINSGTINVETSGTASKGISSSLLTIGEVNNTDGVSPTINVIRTATVTESGTSIGIYSSGDMTLHDGTITIGADNGNQYNQAIEVGGLFTLNNGTIDATVTNKGIVVNSATINNGTIKGNITDTNRTDNKGIHVATSLNTAGGYIYIDVEGENACGIYVGGTATISNGHIATKASGMDARGIDIEGELTVGTIDASTQPTIIVQGDIQNKIWDNWYISGLYVNSNMVVNSGSIKIDIRNDKNKFYLVGICAKGKYTQNGGRVESNVDVLNIDGEYGHADGMCVSGQTIINNGTFICTSNGILGNSAGIHALKSMIINNGILEFRNTNASESDNLGRGLYINDTGTIMGGNIIAQGKASAILGSIVLSNDVNDTEESIATLVSSDYDGTNLSMHNDNDMSDINNYKYVEIGVLYHYYLRYNTTANKMYYGDLKNGIEIKKDVLDSLGITIDTSTDTLTLDNVNFTSTTRYGLYIEGSEPVTISLKDNTNNSFTANRYTENKTQYGIKSAVSLTIKGTGTLLSSGVTQAISASLVNYVNSDDYKLKPLKISTDTSGANPTDNPAISTIDYTSIKYIEIGPIASYYLKYNANEGAMYKISSSGSSSPLTTNNQLVYGWSVYNKVLTLNNFELSTVAPKGLVVEGNANIVIEGNNDISLIYDSNSSYTGLDSSNDINLSGTGTLNLKIYNDTTNKYTGIKSVGDISITSGTYNIEGTQYGIQASSKNLAVNNANVIVKGNTKAIDVGTCNIHAKVEGDTNYNGTNLTQITDINTTYTSTYNGYHYFKISPAVMTIDITWGSMSFEGQKAWDPATHTYIGKWTPAETGGDTVTITNTTESNIPIFAKAQYTPNGNSLSDVITAQLSANNQQIAVGSDISTKLSLSNMPNMDITTTTSIGSVSITLSDYAIP